MTAFDRDAAAATSGSTTLRGTREGAGVRGEPRSIGLATVGTWAALATIIVAGAWLRASGLGAVGFNTDEAVYVGQAAAIANDRDLAPYFPLFRAHPLLYQFMLAAVFAVTGVDDVAGRMASVVIGVVTIWLVY